MDIETTLADANDTDVVDDAAIMDVTPALDIEDFDFADFVDGSEPGRRAVKLYMRAELAADIERLDDAAANAQTEDEYNDLVAQMEHLQDQFVASGRWFVIERKSSEWVRAFRRDLAKRANLKIKDDNSGNPSDELTAALHQLVEQIVTPSKGVTATSLRALYDKNEPELTKLLRTMYVANGGFSETVVTRDFSQPSFGKTGTEAG